MEETDVSNSDTNVYLNTNTNAYTNTYENSYPTGPTTDIEPPYPLSETGPSDTLTPLNAAEVDMGVTSGPQVEYTNALQQQIQAPLAESQPLAASGAFSPPPFQLSSAQQTAIKEALAKLEESFVEEYAQGVPESVLNTQRQALQKRMMAEYAEAYMKEQLAAYQAAKEQQETALEDTESDLAAANATKAAASSLMTQAQAAAGVAATNRQLMVTKQQELGSLQKTVVQLTEQRGAAEQAKGKAESAREAAITNATAKQAALAQAQQLNERLLEDVEDYTEAQGALEAATAAYDTAVEERDAAVAAAEEARTIYTQKQTARSAAVARVTQLEAEIVVLDGLVKAADDAAKEAAAAAEALTQKETALAGATKAAGEAEAARVAAEQRVQALDADETLLKQLDSEKTALQEALSRAETELVTSTQIVTDAQAEIKRLTDLQMAASADRGRLDTDIETLEGLTRQIEQLRAALRAKRQEADAAICDARDTAGILANATTARESALKRLQDFTGLRNSIMTLISQIETTKSQIVAAQTLVAQREKELAAAAPLYPDAVSIKNGLDTMSSAFTTAYDGFTKANDAHLPNKTAADTARSEINVYIRAAQGTRLLNEVGNIARMSKMTKNSYRAFLQNCIIRYMNNSLLPNTLAYVFNSTEPPTNQNPDTNRVLTISELNTKIQQIDAHINDPVYQPAKAYFDRQMTCNFSEVSLIDNIKWLQENGHIVRNNPGYSFWQTASAPVVFTTGGLNTAFKQLSLWERFIELPVLKLLLETIRPAIQEYWALEQETTSTLLDERLTIAGDKIKEMATQQQVYSRMFSDNPTGYTVATTFGTYFTRLKGDADVYINTLRTNLTTTEATERTTIAAREAAVASVQSAGGNLYTLLNQIADKFNVFITNTQTAPATVPKTTATPPDWVPLQGAVQPPQPTRLIEPPGPTQTGFPLFPAGTKTPLGIDYSTWDIGFTPSPEPAFMDVAVNSLSERRMSQLWIQSSILLDALRDLGFTHSPTYAPFGWPSVLYTTEDNSIKAMYQLVQNEVTRLRTEPAPDVNTVWDSRFSRVHQVQTSGAGQPGSVWFVNGTTNWTRKTGATDWNQLPRLVSRKAFQRGSFLTFKVASGVHDIVAGFLSTSSWTTNAEMSDKEQYFITTTEPTLFITQAGSIFLSTAFRSGGGLRSNNAFGNSANPVVVSVNDTITILWLPNNLVVVYRNNTFLGSRYAASNNEAKPLTGYRRVVLQSYTASTATRLTDIYFGQIPGISAMTPFDKLVTYIDTFKASMERLKGGPSRGEITVLTDNYENRTYSFIDTAAKHYRNLLNFRTYEPICKRTWAFIGEYISSINTTSTKLRDDFLNTHNNDTDMLFKYIFRNSSESNFSSATTGIVAPTTADITRDTLTRITNLRSNINDLITNFNYGSLAPAKQHLDILYAQIPGFIAEAGKTYTIAATNTTAINAANSLNALNLMDGITHGLTGQQQRITNWNATTRVLSFPRNTLALTQRLGIANNMNFQIVFRDSAGNYQKRTMTKLWANGITTNEVSVTLHERYYILPAIRDKLDVLITKRRAFDDFNANAKNALHTCAGLYHLRGSYSANSAPGNMFLSFLQNNTATGFTSVSQTVGPTFDTIVANYSLKSFDTATGFIGTQFTNVLNTSRTAINGTDYGLSREATVQLSEYFREHLNEIISDFNADFGRYIYPISPENINAQLPLPNNFIIAQPPPTSQVPYTRHTMTNALSYINGLIQQYIAARAAAQKNLDDANATLTQRTQSLSTQQGQLQTLIGQVQTLYAAATGAFNFDGPESGPLFTVNGISLPNIFTQLDGTSTQAQALFEQATTANTTAQAAATTQITAYRSLRSQLIAQLQAKDLKLRELLRDFSAYLQSTSLTVQRTPVASGPFADAAQVQETGASGANINQAGGATATLASPSPLQSVPSTASGPVCSSGPNVLEPEATINYSTLEGQLATINTNLNNYLTRLTTGITDLNNDLRLWNKIKRVQTAKKTTAEGNYAAKAAAHEAQQKLITSTYQPTPAAVRQDLTTKTSAATQTAQQQTTAQNQRDTAFTTKTTKDEASSSAIVARNAKLASVYETFSSAIQAAASGAESVPSLDTITQIHQATLAAREAAVAAFQEATTAKSSAEKVESAAITAANGAQTDKVEAEETYMTNLRELYLQYGPNVTLSVTGLEELPDMQLPSGAAPSSEVQALEILQEASGASGSFGAFMLNTFLQRSQAYEQAVQERTQAVQAYTEAATALTSVQAAEAQATQAVQEKTTEIATTFNNQTLEQLTTIEQTAKTFAAQKVAAFETAATAVQTLEEEVQKIAQQIQQSEIAVTTATQMSIAAQAEVAAAETAEETAEEQVEEVYETRVEESRAVAETIRLEESRAVAETIRLEESRAVAEVKRIEESRAVAEVKRIEESRAAAESKAEVERLEASRAVAEVERLNKESMAIADMIEENRVAEESRAVAVTVAQQARREALQKQMSALLGPMGPSGSLPSGAAATDAALEGTSGAFLGLPLISAIATEIQTAVEQLTSAQTALTTASVELVTAQGEVTRVSAELKLVQAAILEAIRVGAAPAVVQQLQAREQQLLQELKEAQQTVTVVENAITKLEAQVEQLETFIAERQEQQAEIQETFRSSTLAAIAEKEVQLKTLTESMNGVQKTVQELTETKAATEKELEQVVSQLETATGAQRTMLLATKARLEKELVEIEESLKVVQASLIKLQASVGTVQEEIQALQAQLESAEAAQQQVVQALGEQSGAVASAQAERVSQIQAAEQEASVKLQEAQQSVATMVEGTGIAKVAEQIRQQQQLAEQQLALAMGAVGEAASQANLLESGATQLSSITEISKEIQGILTQLTELQTGYVKATVQEAQIQGEVERIQVELDSLRAALMEAIRIGAPPALVSQLQARETELVAQLTEAQTTLASVQTVVKTIQEQITTTNEVLKEKQEQQVKLEETVRSASLSIIQQREKQLDAIEESIEKTGATLETLTIRKEALEKELDTVQAQLVNATGSQRQLLLAKQETLQQEITKTQTSIATATTSLAQLQQSAKAIQAEIQMLQEQIKTITAARISIVEALEKQVAAVAAQEEERQAQVAAIQTENLAKAEQAEKTVQAMVRDSGVSETAIREVAQKRIEELNRQKQSLIAAAKLQRAESRKLSVSAIPLERGVPSTDILGISFRRALNSLRSKLTAAPVETMVPAVQTVEPPPEPEEPEEEAEEAEAPAYGYGYGPNGGNNSVENTVMTGGANINAILNRLQSRLDSFKPENPVVTQTVNGAVEEVSTVPSNTSYGEPNQQGGRRRTRKVKNIKKK